MAGIYNVEQLDGFGFSEANDGGEKYYVFILDPKNPAESDYLYADPINDKEFIIRRYDEGRHRKLLNYEVMQLVGDFLIMGGSNGN